MKIALSKEQYQFIKEVVVDPLRKKDAKVWCFGSRARGDHNEFSDLDLMVESKENLSSLIGEINETLESSNFPFKVDLIEEKNFADSYRESFEKDKILFK